MITKTFIIIIILCYWIGLGLFKSDCGLFDKMQLDGFGYIIGFEDCASLNIFKAK